jgi:hypothetical protein
MSWVSGGSLAHRLTCRATAVPLPARPSCDTPLSRLASVSADGASGYNGTCSPDIGDPLAPHWYLNQSAPIIKVTTVSGAPTRK